MKIDFKINEKDHSANILINPIDAEKAIEQKNLLALVTMVCADFYLDPELELEQLNDFIHQAKEKESTILLTIDEEGIDLEFIKES